MAEFRYSFAKANYAESQLQSEAVAAVPGCFGVCAAPGTVVILYPSALTAAQQTSLAGVVAAHVPAAPTAGQIMDRRAPPARVGAALAIHLSTQWATLTAARQASLQAVIDAEATALLALLGPG